MRRNQHDIEGGTLYYHNQETITKTHHNSWNQALNIEGNENMSSPENVPMAKVNSPMGSLGDSTPKTYIICGHLLGTSGHKLRRKKLQEIMHRE